MALKDLVAKRGSLAEEAIEEIVSEYVRYDPEEKKIAFTPSAGRLQSRAKALVYLVALQGWPFVSETETPVDARPSEISDETGIPGGTLRPLLKDLKERHIITEQGGRYSVRPVSLASIKAAVSDEGGEKISLMKRRRSRGPQSGVPSGKLTETNVPGKKSTRKGLGKKTRGLAARFRKWIEDGYFAEPKTLAEVQKRFQKEGVIISQSRVSPLLLRAIRAGHLTREEIEQNKKLVWVYRS